VKRRTAIKQIGFGLSAGFVLPSLLSACDEKDKGPEVPFDGVVGVIGAGAAGLFAADILRSKGVKVRIFEASRRVGGRIYSVRPNDPDFTSFAGADFPTELGAERILGSDGAWAKLVKSVGARQVEYKTLGTPQYIIDNALKTEAEALTDSDFVAAQNFLTNLSSVSGSTVQSAIDGQGISSRMDEILNAWIGNEFGADNSTLSATGLAEALALRTRDTREFVLKSNPMTDVLLSRFAATVDKVEVNRQVIRIAYNGDVVDLTVKNLEDLTEETVTVNKLIVAVPLSILKDGDIEFSPGLPGSKTSAMGNLGMAASMRVVLDFRENIWGDTSTFVVGGTKAPAYFNAGLGRSEFTKILSVTVNGTKAEALSALNNNAFSELVNELAQPGVLGAGATTKVKSAFIIKDWLKDPFIKGGYSYPLAGGGEADRVALAEPIEGTLFFAGEATDVKGDWGTVNGALNSGERAAFEVIDAILNPVVA
jgi:monoamine oxidase